MRRQIKPIDNMANCRQRCESENVIYDIPTKEDKYEDMCKFTVVTHKTKLVQMKLKLQHQSTSVENTRIEIEKLQRTIGSEIGPPCSCHGLCTCLQNECRDLRQVIYGLCWSHNYTPVNKQTLSNFLIRCDYDKLINVISSIKFQSKMCNGFVCFPKIFV